MSEFGTLFFCSLQESSLTDLTVNPLLRSSDLVGPTGVGYFLERTDLYPESMPRVMTRRSRERSLGRGLRLSSERVGGR